ncbi:hypothetical protein ABW20_dc0108221 [Dactylellina cionopaga]|nr:hypothetical protein ABW20_dc0108221 [Dactylellina cionopaga]
MAEQYGVESLRPASSCPLCLFRVDAHPTQDYEPNNATSSMEASQGEKKRLVLQGRSEKRVKLSSDAIKANKKATSWAMGSHIAEHLHYLMIVSLQLMSAMNGASDGEGDTQSVPSTPSGYLSVPGDDRLKNRLDDLPSELQGSIAWSDFDNLKPERSQRRSNLVSNQDEEVEAISTLQAYTIDISENSASQSTAEPFKKDSAPLNSVVRKNSSAVLRTRALAPGIFFVNRQFAIDNITQATTDDTTQLTTHDIDPYSANKNAQIITDDTAPPVADDIAAAATIYKGLNTRDESDNRSLELCLPGGGGGPSGSNNRSPDPLPQPIDSLPRINSMTDF